MGARLEMTMTKTPFGVILLTGLLTLAGCGNDPSQVDYLQLGKEIGTQLRPSSESQAPLASPAQAMAVTQGPLILVRPQPDRQGAYLVGVRDNGPYRTYATVTRESMVFRDGLVTATRGLGDDLMASDVTEVAALLRAGKSGQARREMQFLNAGDETQTLSFTCTIAAAPDNSGMTEDCAAGDLRFRNSYVMDAAGRIISSTQWLSRQRGSAVMDVIRH